jgi:hypothetical protein
MKEPRPKRGFFTLGGAPAGTPGSCRIKLKHMRHGFEAVCRCGVCLNFSGEHSLIPSGLPSFNNYLRDPFTKIKNRPAAMAAGGSKSNSNYFISNIWRARLMAVVRRRW